MSYKLIKGIIKVIKPKDKPVIGIGDGIGNFTWIPTDKMIDYFPKPYIQWQTTFFKMDIAFEPKWREEKNFEQYAYTYEQNTIAAPANVPPDFLAVQTQTTQTQPTNYPQPSQTITQPPPPQTAQTLSIPDPVTTTSIPDPFSDVEFTNIPVPIDSSTYHLQQKTNDMNKLIELIETQNGILQNILNAIIKSKTKITTLPITNGTDLGTTETAMDRIPKLDF